MTPDEQADALHREVLGVCGRFRLEFDLGLDAMVGVLDRAKFDLLCGSIEFQPGPDFGGEDDVGFN